MGAKTVNTFPLEPSNAPKIPACARRDSRTSKESLGLAILAMLGVSVSWAVAGSEMIKIIKPIPAAVRHFEASLERRIMFQ